MKLLSIENGRGFFFAEGGAPKTLDQISKEDVLRLVELALSSEIEMDEYDASRLMNQAHQIIYQNIWTRLAELSLRRNEFLDESKRQYLAEYERYRNAATEESSSRDLQQPSQSDYAQQEDFTPAHSLVSGQGNNQSTSVGSIPATGGNDTSAQAL